jgi:hypothetical protein
VEARSGEERPDPVAKRPGLGASWQGRLLQWVGAASQATAAVAQGPDLAIGLDLGPESIFNILFL